ncbi:MAG: PA14 domain-containing protein [Ginsengibacter sp.]
MKQELYLLVILSMWILSSCNKKGVLDDDDNVSGKAFGDSIPISNGLKGKVFLLPVTTTKLPDFDTMQPLPNAIYLKQVDIPIQNWSAGFPGLRDRFEWFGIEYTGFFKPIKPGSYLFKLVSDDGSQLFIDDSLFINNDGLHSEWPVRGNIYLSDSLHSIKLRYFQGPRYQLGLQLFWSPDGEDSLKIFPGNQFLLQAPKPTSRWWIWLLIGIGIIIAAGVIIYKNKKSPNR